MPRLNALFLLFLFLLVIAFPGYGRSVRSGSASMIQTSETSISIIQLLKRCLQTGINLIEEERSNEEGEDSSSSCICFELYDQVSPFDSHLDTLEYFTNHSFSLLDIILKGSYPPPDCI